MLEVKILKLRHMGREAAVMLRPHIRESDVLSPEAAGLSEQGADSFEKQWLNLLTLSRTALRKSLIIPNNEYGAFVAEFQESAYREKKPVYILERFTEVDARTITTLSKRFMGPYTTDFLESAVRGEKKSLETLKSNLVGYIQSLLLRDQEIGRNLITAESEIRRRFPSLKSKDKIRLTVYIGRCHYPEKHTPIETEVIWLPTKKTETDVLIERLYSSGDWSNVSDEDIKLLASYTINNEHLSL